MSFQLTIEPLGETIEVEDGQSILDAALRAGVWLPYACNHGLCGTCKVDVLEGEVDHNEASPFALMDVERDENRTLACCATLQSDVVIEAEIDEDEDARQIAVEDRVGTVSRIESLTPTIKGIWIDVDGEAVVAFERRYAGEPGAQVVLQVDFARGLDQQPPAITAANNRDRGFSGAEHLDQFGRRRTVSNVAGYEFRRFLVLG